MSTFTNGLARISRQLRDAVGGSAIAERPAGRMAKALRGDDHPATMSSESFLAKALAMNAAGRLSSSEVSECESAIAKGHQPRADLVRAVALNIAPGLRGDHDAAFRQLQRNLNITLMAKGGADAVIRTEAPAGRLAPSERDVVGGMSSDHFMIKAADAQQKGVITATELATCEQYINGGKQPPAKLVKAVLNGEEIPSWQR